METTTRTEAPKSASANRWTFSLDLSRRLDVTCETARALPNATSDGPKPKTKATRRNSSLISGEVLNDLFCLERVGLWRRWAMAKISGD